MSLFPNDIERLETKVDKILDHTASIDVTLAKQQVSLDDHIRRTELLEIEIKPLKEAHALWRGTMKTLAILHVSGASILAALKWVFHKI